MRTIWSRVAIAMVTVWACNAPTRLAPTDAPPGAPDAARPDAPVPSDGVVSLDAPSSPLDAFVDADAATSTSSGGDPFAAYAALPPVCSDAGWCWFEPRPSGTSLGGIASSAPDNIWIEGGGPPSYAAIMQWNGQHWITHKPPVPDGYPEYLAPEGLATTGPNDTWLDYSNLVEHWDGTEWKIIVGPTSSGGGYMFDGLWIDPHGDPWFTRADGVVLRWHAGVMTTVATGIFPGTIWGTAIDDVFVTSIGGIQHYDGTSFSLIYSGAETAGGYSGVRNDVWISGLPGKKILHWNGSTMTEMETGITESAALVHPAQYNTRSDISWVSTGASAAPTYFLHWNGVQFTKTPIETAYTALGDNICDSLQAASVIDGRWWLLCGGGEVATRSGPTTIQSIVDQWDAPGGAVWGPSRSDLYFASADNVRHWDGFTWSVTPERVAGLSGIAGTGVGGTDELFGIRQVYQGSDSTYHDFLEHFDGSDWTSTLLTEWVYQQPGGRPITAVYPIGHDEAMIVGGNGTAIHYQDGVLTMLDPGTTASLYGVWGPDADHLWLTGTGGTLLQWTRSNPTAITRDPTSPTVTDDLIAITSAGGTTWIVPQNQTYIWMKSATNNWEQVGTPVVAAGVAAISATNAVVSGNDGGEVARWNGSAFTMEQYPNAGLNNHISALPDGTTILCGQSGILYHP